MPGTRTGSVEGRYATSSDEGAIPKRAYPFIFAVRSVLLAYDRRVLLTRAFARAANGRIVLCDRYPSSENGATDSPQLTHLTLPPGRFPARRLLARLEATLYRGIPPADLVLSLRVPMEVALVRNRQRGKEEPEEYVRRRHARASAASFGTAPVHVIHTNGTLDSTILEVKRAIWAAL
jgi:thymidylate kinase